VRYRDENGKTQTAATLNGTLATTRWIVAILENHQQPDGSVKLPKALQPMMGREILEPVKAPSSGRDASKKSAPSVRG
ncbi:MAG: hypothetical protein ACRDUA_00075, partial [Micromonosporaceae bacterium]